MSDTRQTADTQIPQDSEVTRDTNPSRDTDTQNDTEIVQHDTSPLEDTTSEEDTSISEDTSRPEDTSPSEDTSSPEDAAPDVCQPNCENRVCGDNGCGQSCGACGAGMVCGGGQCACDARLPEGWPSVITPWVHNPVITPTSTASVHGDDNIYAPDIHRHGGAYVMWYGGQSNDGHDRIFMAYGLSEAEWRTYPNSAQPVPALDRGNSNHINDPSVVRVGGEWKMYYTDADVDINDRVWLATSTSVTGFRKVSMVIDVGPPGSWEDIRVGRPSVIYENGMYKMWYDGTSAGGRHVGYATSTDGVNFTKHRANPVFLNAGAIDVKRVGGVFVMLRESGAGTDWATSVDGLCWVDRGRLFNTSGQDYDRFGQVTPFLQVENGQLRAIWFGGASVSTWNRNRIAVAWPQNATLPQGGGCTACTSPGLSCAEACSPAFSAGSCAAPGSTNPGACCACASDGCEACRGDAISCHAACISAGRAGGWCAVPGSADPSACCSCLE